MLTFLGRRWGASLIGALALALVLAVVVALGVVAREHLDEPRAALTITVLSSRPDTITGGDARVRVSAPGTLRLADIRVWLNSRDVSRQFVVTDVGLEGVIQGIKAGRNTLEATAPQARSAIVTLTNHLRSGPLFSGPQADPYVCETATFLTRTGIRLGDPVDDSCSIETSVSHLYFSSREEKLLPLDVAAATDPARRPADLATVTPPDGVTRPFIVRVETSTVDRGIAQVAMLDDPADAPGPAWNRKLIYAFGGSCGGGHRQGSRAVGVMSPHLLSQGYAVASNSLNAFEQNCNDVLAAEAFAMTREEFIERHGVPAFTMGIGCSGGAAQAYQIADNYPGLLDGIVAGCSVADLGFDVGQLAFDARLLQDYATRFPGRLTPEQLRAVSGLGSLGALRDMSEMARILHPTAAFHPVVPADQRFRAVGNVPGARSTIWDQSVNVYGTAPDSPRARRPLGNVGVQYGLQAFEEGAISAEQFIALNASIGGRNVDFEPTARRTTADGPATRAAYATGRLLNGGGGLGDIPIIDYRSHGYGAAQGPGAPAMAPLDLAHHTFVVQQRLIEANGDADNLVLLADSGRGRFLLESGRVAEAIEQMDRWITAAKALPVRGHRAVVDSRPADLVDACWTPQGRKIAERQSYQGGGECATLYPAYATPRMVAGGPLTSDVIACALRPVDPSGYGVSLSSAQVRRLEAIFPSGVCDWRRGGQWQRGLSGNWRSY